MTEQGNLVAEIWRDPDFASDWASSDTFGDLLVFPRHVAAAIVGNDNPSPRLVVDIGSGPGAFLSTFLDEFPEACGVWSDASEAMQVEARDRLASYGDRVEYLVGDMTDLAACGIPCDADVVMTSRAAHHLDRPALAAFYRQVADRLVPGGWVINLDHTGTVDRWDKRFRAVRPRFAKRKPDEPKNHHNHPLTSIVDHIDALGEAGIMDVEIPWKAFYTCLFMGRKDG